MSLLMAFVQDPKPPAEVTEDQLNRAVREVFAKPAELPAKGSPSIWNITPRKTYPRKTRKKDRPTYGRPMASSPRDNRPELPRLETYVITPWQKEAGGYLACLEHAQSSRPCVVFRVLEVQPGRIQAADPVEYVAAYGWGTRPAPRPKRTHCKVCCLALEGRVDADFCSVKCKQKDYRDRKRAKKAS